MPECRAGLVVDRLESKRVAEICLGDLLVRQITEPNLQLTLYCVV